jgi:hypothetical protein
MLGMKSSRRPPGWRGRQSATLAHDAVPQFRFQTWAAAFVMAYLALATAHKTAAQTRLKADLELVFAVDASSSIDLAEYALQLRGIASALRDPDVLSAIDRGRHGKIAVNLVIWAQPGYAPFDMGWSIVSNPEDANALASRVEKLPRRQFGGTGIGEGIRYAVSSLQQNAINAPRMVIDVSGDGRETELQGAMLLPEARALAHESGIIINGLAVLDEDPDLADYYSNKLRIGAESFVLTAATYRDFADAMKLKLLREVSMTMSAEFWRKPPAGSKQDSASLSTSMEIASQP